MSRQTHTPDMRERLHVPFDAWAMPVDVSVSQLVRVGDLAWSCGQCPLDDKGAVMTPDDLVAQTRIVCDYIEAMLPRAGMDNGSIAKLDVYYLEQSPADRPEMLAIFRERFGDVPLLVPIAVPHFYYDGLMIEVDVFASAVAKRLPEMSATMPGASLQSTDGGELAWAKLVWLNNPAGIASRDALIGKMSAWDENLLATKWIVPASGSANVPTNMEPPSVLNFGRPSVVRTALDQPHIGIFTFVQGELVQHALRDDPETALSVSVSQAGSYVSAHGYCSDSGQNLVTQTRSIMEKLDAALAKQSMSFANVTKLTACYVGAPTPEELHGNMKVRHGYYVDPGLASTGLPVAGLAAPENRIAIDVIAVG